MVNEPGPPLFLREIQRRAMSKSELNNLIKTIREKNIKFVVVTGGVCSSLGKGVLVSSLGALFQDASYTVSVMKCDPYLNVDPGTMSPLEHGEVFVTADGAETDLDLGHYERMLDVQLLRDSSLSAGQVFASILEGERRGDYLGRCIQLVPHVVDRIKERLLTFALVKNVDIVLVEIGGTVGDIEGMVFLEALRQLKLELGHAGLFHAHLSYVPFLSWTGEIKTKPTQHSVNELKKSGLVPDALFLRCDQSIDAKARAKVALMCGIPAAHVFEVLTLQPTIRLLFALNDQHLIKVVTDFFEKDEKAVVNSLAPWRTLISKIEGATQAVSIGLVMKYVGNNDPYLSVVEAVKGAAYHEQLVPHIVFINAEKLEQGVAEEWDKLKQVQGIIVPGGFDKRGAEGKIQALQWARENKVPCLGLCLGFQLMLVEAVRSLLGIGSATSAEFDPTTAEPVIALLDEQLDISSKGGTMRLGEYPCTLQSGSLAHKAYDAEVVHERHRHRYEFNNSYRERLQQKGVIFSGLYQEKDLVEIVEIKDHPFMVGTQFHPEFKGSYLQPHPLFRLFIQVVKK